MKKWRSCLNVYIKTKKNNENAKTRKADEIFEWISDWDWTMIHSQLSKRRIQMLWWFRRNLTKCESRTVDSEIIQVHWTIVWTQKNQWRQVEMKKPIFQTWMMMNLQISKRKKILYGFDVACNHRWADDTFIIYFEIIWKWQSQNFSSYSSSFWLFEYESLWYQKQ